MVKSWICWPTRKRRTTLLIPWTSWWARNPFFFSFTFTDKLSYYLHQSGGDCIWFHVFVSLKLRKKFFCQECWSVAFVCLSVCLFLTRFLATVFRQSFWIFLCISDRPKRAMHNFNEDLNPNMDLDTRIFQVILHHWEIEPKTICSINDISRSYGRIRSKLVDTLGVRRGWRVSILVQVGIQIWAISGIQNVNSLAWRRYALCGVPFHFAKCCSVSDFSFVRLSVSLHRMC